MIPLAVGSRKDSGDLDSSGLEVMGAVEEFFFPQGSILVT
jgi:hypothetical protein